MYEIFILSLNFYSPDKDNFSIENILGPGLKLVLLCKTLVAARESLCWYKLACALPFF